MMIIPEPICFDWDKGNIDKNLRKHRITNKEAEEVFENKPLFISEDKAHSRYEKRFQALGITNQRKKLFLSFTLREDKVRIISARPMSKKERRAYEAKAKTHTTL